MADLFEQEKWVLIDPDLKRYEFEDFDKLYNYIKGSYLHMTKENVFLPLMRKYKEQ